MSVETLPPGFSHECHPEVFTKPPPQPTEKKPGQLSPNQLEKLFQKGFLVVENFFDPAELEPCRDAVNQLVEDLAQKLYKSGKIKSLYKEYGFDNRLIMLEKEWPGAVVLLLKLGQLPQAFRDLWNNTRLVNVVEQLVGPEVAAHTIWNLRPKTPGHEETLVPWHQDSAYMDKDSYSTHVATAWVPFVDATRENGCMEFATGGHQKGIIGVHECCENFYLMLSEDEMKNRLGVDMEKTEIVEVPYGGVLFFNNCTPHRSIPNTTDKIRWSIDLRWQSSEKPWGFFGLKSGLPLRSAKNPDLIVNWDEYDEFDRYKIQKKYELDKLGQDASKFDEFDTTITGPHFDKYHIVKHSIHVDQYQAKKRNEEDSR